MDLSTRYKNNLSSLFLFKSRDWKYAFNVSNLFLFPLLDCCRSLQFACTLDSTGSQSFKYKATLALQNLRPLWNPQSLNWNPLMYICTSFFYFWWMSYHFIDNSKDVCPVFYIICHVRIRNVLEKSRNIIWKNTIVVE